MTEPPDFAHTGFARDARVRKATRIEAALRMGGVDAAGARALNDGQRREVEHVAGVRKSSDETWETAFTLMEAWRPQTPPVCPACEQPQGDDPAICHHCDGVIGWSPWQDARAPGTRFCSEVCSLAHLVGQT